ncbi:MAG: immunity 26/phosphotriesterase HocA family protein, partial [Oscillospiraceae bacterium]
FGGCAVSFNSSNDQSLPVPETQITCPEDFYDMAEKYIASLPADYDKQLDNFINKKRKTVKFTAGDIFRIQLSPNEYTYCLILGKVREILKWKEVPDEHPLRGVMCQPIIYRQYRIRTTDPQISAEELSKHELLPMKIAQDNFILWETYPITAHKELEENDIDLGFGYDMGKVTWGLNCCDLGKDILPELNCRSCDNYGMYIYIDYVTNFPDDPNEPLETNCTRVRDMLAKKLGFGEDYSMDDFVRLYGGMSRKEYIRLAKERSKK